MLPTNGNGVTGSAAVIRRMNEARVLSQLRIAGSVSRADLARLVRVDP
jgi:hypothetical protein